jgi:hypothetical protein
MQTGKILLGIIVVSVAFVVAAQADPDPDGIGVYFDEAATMNGVFAEPGEIVDGYLIATNLTHAEPVVYWEATVRATGPVENVWGVPRGGGWDSWNDMPGGLQDIMTVWYLGDPLPVQEILVLADMHFTLYLDVDELVWIYVAGYADNEIPRYQTGTFDDPYYEMYPVSGDPEYPVAVINGEPPIAARSQAWSNVKALYR